MANNAFFLHQIKRTNGNYDKGIVVKTGGTAEENFEAAKQAYHAYLGAYAYNNNANTDYVSCMITGFSGAVVDPFSETWIKTAEEPVAEA